MLLKNIKHLFLLHCFAFLSLVSCSERFDLQGNTIGVFAYNNQRNALVSYVSKKIELIKPQVKKWKAIKSDERTPLYINGKKLFSNGLVPESDLLLSTNNNYLYLTDLQNDRLVFESEKLPGDFLFATPYFDSLEKLFYVISIKIEDYKDKGGISFPPKYIHYLSLVDLMGKVKSSYKIPLQNIYSEKDLKQLKDYPVESYIMCKTAPLVYRQDNMMKVVLGCSIRTNHAEDSYYANKKELSGSVIAFNVKNEKISFSDVFFTANSVRGVDDSGFDGGIYNSGSGISENKGSLFVAVGNASVGKNNFGCSIVKLSSKTLKLEGSYFFYPGPNGECHALNLDSSSAAVPVYNFKNTQYFSGTNKSGKVCFFSNSSMTPLNCIILSSLPFYSNGVFFEKNGQLYYLSHFFNSETFFQDVVVAGDSQTRDLERIGYKQEKCVGHVKLENTFEMNYYYSGEFRDRYVASPEDLTVQKMPKFMKDVKLYDKSIKDYWPNYELTSLKPLRLDKNGELRAALYLYNQEIFSVHLLFPDVHKKHIDELSLVKLFDISAGVKKGCEKTSDKELIYSFTRASITKEAWGAKLFKLENSKFVLSKIFSFDGFLDPSKSQPLVVMDNDNVYGVIAGQSFKTGQSRIVFQNLFNEKERQSVDFKGNFHFNSPLISGAYIFFSTMNNGIQAFKWMN